MKLEARGHSARMERSGKTVRENSPEPAEPRIFRSAGSTHSQSVRENSSQRVRDTAGESEGVNRLEIV